MTAPFHEQEVTTRVIYSGRVQGVGFRFTTRELAENFPVTGFVRNLPDGTVELVAHGTPEAVRDFLIAVSTRFRSNIADVDQSSFDTEEAFDSFEIFH